MDYDIVIFWSVVLYGLVGLAMTLMRVGSIGSGWVALNFTIVLIAVLGKMTDHNACIHLAAVMWVTLVLLPGLIGKRYQRHLLRQQYPAAERLARVISWLHPADGWRQQPEIVHALDLAQQGQISVALETLKRFENLNSMGGLSAMASLFRITNRWEDCVAWETVHQKEIERTPQLLPVMLRARGETGDLRGLVELYHKNRARIGKLVPATSRDMCRVILFAFCGRRDLLEQVLFRGSLVVLPASTRAFWLATADLAAGASGSGKQQLELLLPAADLPTRMAIERRLTRALTPAASLDAAAGEAVNSTALEHNHDESFGAQRSLFSKQALATQILIALNVLMFAAEEFCGGGSNPAALFRLGAVWPPSVWAGEWWRLLAAMFLHFGALHLSLNMLALWVLGPFVEFALGFKNFLLVYLLAGLGAGGMVMAFSSGPNGDQLFAGASGCIMGLVGATGALMLRGWMREKAQSARKRLLVVFLILAVQSIFDSVVPQVSMTAHLTGALLGFAMTLLLRDRLRIPFPANASQ